jgi:hypothetical protein
MPLPDREKLKDIVNDHFVYEVTELFGCKKLWTMYRPPLFESAFINMNIEHTLLHARVLYDFYYKLDHQNGYNENSYPRANMYVPTFTRPSYTSEITEDFEAKVNAQINHLGLERTSTPSEKFNVGQTVAIANKLLAITKEFLNPIETEDGGYFFQAGLRDLKPNIDSFVQFNPFQPITSPVALIPIGTPVVAVTSASVTSSSYTSGNVFP